MTTTRVPWIRANPKTDHAPTAASVVKTLTYAHWTCAIPTMVATILRSLAMTATCVQKTSVFPHPAPVTAHPKPVSTAISVQRTRAITKPENAISPTPAMMAMTVRWIPALRRMDRVPIHRNVMTAVHVRMIHATPKALVCTQIHAMTAMTARSTCVKKEWDASPNGTRASSAVNCPPVTWTVIAPFIRSSIIPMIRVRRS